MSLFRHDDLPLSLCLQVFSNCATASRSAARQGEEATCGCFPFYATSCTTLTHLLCSYRMCLHVSVSVALTKHIHVRHTKEFSTFYSFVFVVVCICLNRASFSAFDHLVTVYGYPKLYNKNGKNTILLFSSITCSGVEKMANAFVHLNSLVCGLQFCYCMSR